MDRGKNVYKKEPHTLIDSEQIYCPNWQYCEYIQLPKMINVDSKTMMKYYELFWNVKT